MLNICRDFLGTPAGGSIGVSTAPVAWAYDGVIISLSPLRSLATFAPLPSSKLVVTMPGETACTVQQPSPSLLSWRAAASRESVLESCGIAALLEPYAADRGVALPRLPDPSTFTTTPPVAWVAMTVSAARAPSRVPMRLVPTTFTTSSSGVSVRRARRGCVQPALLTQRSRPPSSFGRRMISIVSDASNTFATAMEDESKESTATEIK